MNILFVTDNEVTEISGGIARITHNLSVFLMNACFYNCYSAYFIDSFHPKHPNFVDKIKISKDEKSASDIRDFIIKNNINVVIVSTVINNHDYTHYILPILSEISNSLKKINIIYCYHGRPCAEFIPQNTPIEISSLFQKNGIINLVKKLSYNIIYSVPFLKKIHEGHLHRKYNPPYKYADKIVLLSKYYFSDFAYLQGIEDESKYIEIGNALSFSDFFLEEQLCNKKKEVLIVARLYEQEKRLTDAFKIWNAIEKVSDLSDWCLKIVGTGVEEKYYKSLVRRLKLKRVFFEGHQNPIPYYKNASIFMMTSATEGFPMVLGEALQMGVVPIAFDSFASLHSIVHNEYDGIIVPNFNVDLYIESLISLMINSEKRIIMAKNGLSSCRDYTIDKIAKKWVDLFNSLNENE